MPASKFNMLTNFKVAEEQIIFYRTHLDIFIEDAFPPIKLTQDQHVIAREFGNCNELKLVQSRGAGKTWLVALCCHAICCLYPGTPIAVCSGTAAQATLVLDKLRLLAEQNPNIANELTANNSRTLVQLSKDKAKASYKNGSTIESYAITSMRGLREKVVVVDECPEVTQEDQDAIVAPIKNYRRDISFTYQFKDFDSKTINITSACEKSNSFYSEFMRILKEMSNGNEDVFACALDYKAAARAGITPMSFFESEKKRLPSAIFDMEYGSVFIGAANNSAFPYDLTQGCRTLEKIEVEQPKNSKSRYIISLDIATSESKGADNSVITVLKFTEKNDGTFSRKLVYIRSFHGEKLDVLAEEIRKLFHINFPNCEKIIYDARGLGDSLDRFFDKEWVDPYTGKEYPPLVLDDSPNYNSSALQILHPFRAIQALNQRLYSNLRVALEKHAIELPVNYRIIKEKCIAEDRHMSALENAIFIEGDALQYEMGNVIAKIGSSGNVLYDTSSHSVHKDRYSSLAMGNDYISELEKENVKRYQRGPICVGIASKF